MNNNRKTPCQLVIAAERGNIPAIESELSRGNFDRNDYVAALSRAGGHGYMDALKTLVESPFNTMDANERALRWFARHGQVEALRYFVEVKKVPVDCFKGSSVRIAAQYGQYEALVYLHQQNASLTEMNNEAIRSAVRFFHDDVGAYLVEMGVDFCLNDLDFDPNYKTTVEYRSSTNTGDFEVDKWDLFYRVATKGDEMPKTLKAMLDRNLPQIALDVASIKAASYGMLDTYKLLRSYNADVNADNVAAFSEAAKFGHKNMVNHFLEDEPQINMGLGIQRALQKAFKGEHGDIMSLLLSKIEMSTGELSNPVILLDKFLRFKQMNSAKELISDNLWLIFENEDVCLKIVRYGDDDLLKFCIDCGMQIIDTEENFVDAALDKFNFPNARLLLSEGVSPSNIQECLVNCSRFGKVDLISVMIDLGAISSYNNSEALDVAVRFDHTTSAKILRSHGAVATQEMWESARSDEMRTVLSSDPNDESNKVVVTPYRRRKSA